MNRIHLFILITLSLLASGCQSTQPLSQPGAAVSPIERCQLMISRVDQAVIEAGTTDTSVFRVEGFPYLRTNRFLADMAETETSLPAIRQWLTYMHQLDLAAREKEILNLDNHQFLQLVNQARPQTDRRTFIEEVCACSERLFTSSADQQDLAEDVDDAIDIPTEYRTWRRMVGLYPLVALPVGIASDDAFDEFRAWHATPPERLPQIGQPVVYRAAGLNEENRIDPVWLYQTTPMDALGLPQLSPQDEQRLVEALAPTIVQDTLAGYDRIGQVQWSAGELTIARGAPTGYYYLSHGRFKNRPSLQINYVFWYSHRSGDNAPWIEWGRLDGLTVRISLDYSGRPVMLDIMNNCGCYHFFVPDRTQIRSVQTTFMGLDPLVPAWLPDQFPDHRLRLMVSSGWHQVQNIGEDNTADEIVPYKLRPYHELEILADENDQHRSMFDGDGIAWGSDRIEPALFFSMGIPNVGSMRQRGHHAIKMVGRAHFDDPQLFDETFEYR